MSLDDVINNKPPAPSVRRPSAVSLKLSRAGFSRQFEHKKSPGEQGETLVMARMGLAKRAATAGCWEKGEAPPTRSFLTNGD